MNEAEQSFYERLWASGYWSGGAPNADEQDRLNAIAASIERFGPNATTTRVLDVGCGRGWLVAALKERFPQIDEAIGIDPVGEAIGIAKQLHPKLSFHVCTKYLNTSSNLGVFDIVTCSEVLEHIVREEQGRFIGRVTEYLKPTGILVITTPRGEIFKYLREETEEFQPVEEWLTEPTLKDLIKAVGLEICDHKRLWRQSVEYHPSAKYLRRARLRHIVSRFGMLEEKIRAFNSIYQIIVCKKL